MDFLKGAKEFARNPLGIIALFISLIYGVASLLLNYSADKLSENQRWPLVIFVVVFPVLVLLAFYKLVTKHHGKLYAPGDFKDDNSFLRTLSSEELETKLDYELKESLGQSKPETEYSNTERVEPEASLQSEVERKDLARAEYFKFKEELKKIEDLAVNLIAQEHNAIARRNVGIADTDTAFDAYLELSSPISTFVEVKMLRGPSITMISIDRILYNAVVADKFFDSKFKLILVIVYDFEEALKNRIERQWLRKTSTCPAKIEVRFIHKSTFI